jgi:hypothetical protein
MKPSYFTPIVGAGLLALGLTISPFTPPASATLDGLAYTYMLTQPNTAQRESNRHSDFDWKWLGLESLIGLAALSAYRYKKSAGDKVTRDSQT